MKLAPLVAFGLGGNHTNYITAHTFTLLPDTGTKPTPPNPMIAGGGTVFAPGKYQDSWKVIDPLHTVLPTQQQMLTITIRFNNQLICDRTYRLDDRQFNSPTVGVVVPTLIAANPVTPKLIKTEFSHD